ncbi:MAG: NAD(P)/FAD-dependent oxidoreductase [Methyloligellaceae bacterium]
MPELNKIVVIGAGQAGISAVSKLRALGFTGDVTLIGEEPELPYQRPPLTKKFLLGELPRERLYIKPAAFYQDQNIKTISGVRVEAIAPEDKSLVLSNGEKCDWDKLIVTTGSLPLSLPASFQPVPSSVQMIRSLADIDKLQPRFLENKHLLVVGGGYIGLEIAAVASSCGLKVTLVELQDRLLKRVAAAETATYFHDLHEGHGVNIRTSTSLTALEEADDDKLVAKFDDGSSSTVDLIVLGIGIRPNVALAESAGLEIDNGICVGEFGQTSNSDIYAAGDCASFLYKGRRVRLESVQNAIDQAEKVAETIMGESSPYDPVPWFWSDQYDTKLQIAGLNTGFDRTIVRVGTHENSQSVWYYHGDQFLAVDAMNDPRSYMTGRKWLMEGKNPDADRIASGVDLKECV